MGADGAPHLTRSAAGLRGTLKPSPDSDQAGTIRASRASVSQRWLWILCPRPATSGPPNACPAPGIVRAEYSEDVVPVSIRNLVAALVPDHLVKQRGLRAREADGHPALRQVELLS